VNSDNLTCYTDNNTAPADAPTTTTNIYYLWLLFNQPNFPDLLRSGLAARENIWRLLKQVVTHQTSFLLSSQLDQRTEEKLNIITVTRMQQSSILWFLSKTSSQRLHVIVGEINEKYHQRQ